MVEGRQADPKKKLNVNRTADRPQPRQPYLDPSPRPPYTLRLRSHHVVSSCHAYLGVDVVEGRRAMEACGRAAR